jgi:cell division septal protein FtsQ
VDGARIRSGDLRLGRYCKNDQINSAILIVKAFKQIRDLSSFRIDSINVERLSQIEMILNNGLKVIVDTDNVRNKMSMLGVVLTEVNFDLNDTEYVDIRFKQPIRGKKNANNVKKNKRSK